MHTPSPSDKCEHSGINVSSGLWHSLVGKVTCSRVLQPEVDQTPGPTWWEESILQVSSTHVYSYNTYYRIPTYLYIHTYTFKIQRHLVSPTLNWFCTVHSSLFRDTGRMERCLCDGQPAQTTFTLHDWYSLYSIHVSSTNLSFVQYPRQQKLHLSTVCAETLHVVYLDLSCHSSAASAPLHHVCWHCALATSGIWCP